MSVRKVSRKRASGHPHTQEGLLALADVTPGETVFVVEVTDLEHPVTQRLCDLGFLPGTEVLVVRRAPFRDPTIYQLRGNQMCLRRAEAARILVSRHTADDAIAIVDQQERG